MYYRGKSRRIILSIIYHTHRPASLKHPRPRPLSLKHHCDASCLCCQFLRIDVSTMPPYYRRRQYPSYFCLAVTLIGRGNDLLARIPSRLHGHDVTIPHQSRNQLWWSVTCISKLRMTNLIHHKASSWRAFPFKITTFDNQWILQLLYYWKIMYPLSYYEPNQWHCSLGMRV